MRKTLYLNLINAVSLFILPLDRLLTNRISSRFPCEVAEMFSVSFKIKAYISIIFSRGAIYDLKLYFSEYSNKKSPLF